MAHQFAWRRYMSDFDVFVSYAREERHLAEPVRVALENAGLRVFFDLEGGIQAGDAFPQRITNAIAECKVVVACWTPHSLRREWCRKECFFALRLGKLVPLALQRLPDLCLGSEFIDISYVPLDDFTGQSHHLGWSEALNAIASRIETWAKRNPDPVEAATAEDLAMKIKRASIAARPSIVPPRTARQRNSIDGFDETLRRFEPITARGRNAEPGEKRRLTEAQKSRVERTTLGSERRYARSRRSRATAKRKPWLSVTCFNQRSFGAPSAYA